PNGKVAAGGSSRSYDAVILADGAYGRLHGLLNIGYRGSKLLGLNAVAEIKGELDRIVVDFSSRLSDGFFSWIVPVGGEAVIGTAARDPRALKPKMHILARSIGVKGFKRLYGGPVLTGPPAELLWRGRVFVVGDAGGLVKPLTGGGLYPNSVAASMATAIADKEGDPAKALREALCTVGRELRAQHYIARLFLSDKRVAGRAAALARIFKADRALSGSIDFDKHEDLPLAALSSPARMAGVAVGILLDSPRALKSLAGYVASLARSRLAPCKLH
ncbi:MAG: hypothetical protein LRS43_02405, partial [Desulfurococcales archaeon]|nr:hypothetical protein [Desulfurococcales archaeon]